MTYQVLSIKWRPQSFNDVVGQSHITQSLENALKLNRVSHAFTFCGPRGVGKTTVARILSKELNQISSINNSFDIYEMDAASNRGIDEIRSLRENVKILPVHGQYKIYIIDEVHMLTKEAFNALLKTLEEPPDYVKFILATTDPYKLPLTILSRTQRYDFRRIKLKDIVSQLEKILKGEDIKYDVGSLKLIAQKADGSMRDAITCLDQTINFCSNNLKFNEVRKSLGLVDEENYFNLLKLITSKNSSLLIESVKSTLDQGVSVNDFILGFNKYLQKVLKNVVGIKSEDNIALAGFIRDNKEIISELYIIRIMDLFLQFDAKLKFINQPDIALEILMIKIVNLDGIIKITDLLENFTDEAKQNSFLLEKKIPVSNNNLSKKEIADVKVELDSPIIDRNNEDNKRAEKNKINHDSLVSKLPDVISLISNENSKTGNFLENCSIDSVKENIILLKIDNLNSFTYSSLLKDIEIIEDSFSKILNIKCEVNIKKEFKDIKNKKRESRANVVDDDHPLLMDALEKFDGEILK